MIIKTDCLSFTLLFFFLLLNELSIDFQLVCTLENLKDFVNLQNVKHKVYFYTTFSFLTCSNSAI